MIALIGFFIYINNNNNKLDKLDNSLTEDSQTEYFTSRNKSKKLHKLKSKLKRKSKKYYHLKNNTTDTNDNMNNINVNNEFIEMQYHGDYNDTITAINNLTPQKELFNLGFLPVKESVPDSEHVIELVQLFMDKLNNEVGSNVSEYLHTNSGWNDMGKRRKEKSGFEEQMEELGLPGNLYNEFASKAPIKLVKIDKAEKFNTENQIRFVIHIIVQKENVSDQMILKLLFFFEKDDTKNRDKFFTQELNDGSDDKLKEGTAQTAIIEQIFIEGFLTNNANMKTKMDKFHEYKDVYNSDGTINQETVIKTMLAKHKERENELNSFKATLDDETKQKYIDIEQNQYSVYKNTRTIMDDLANYPQKSFDDITI